MSDSHPSFFAIFSDIHANINAFSAVLADTDQFPVRGMFCLGDIVGYGPEPVLCIQRVMDTCAITVLGNHEAMLFLAEEILDEDWGITVGKPILLARDQLSKKQSDWLHSHTLTAVADPLALSHASISDPANFHYIHTPEEASAHFKTQTTFISFNGHTHVPEIWEQDAASGSLTASQLGSSTITRDSKGNTWTTTKVGNSFVTRGPGGQQQTTSKLGNSFVTRDSKTGSTLTTSPVGNSFQTRGYSGASWSTSHLPPQFLARHARQFLIRKEGREGDAGDRDSKQQVAAPANYNFFHAKTPSRTPRRTPTTPLPNHRSALARRAQSLQQCLGPHAGGGFHRGDFFVHRALGFPPNIPCQWHRLPQSRSGAPRFLRTPRTPLDSRCPLRLGARHARSG